MTRRIRLLALAAIALLALIPLTRFSGTQSPSSGSVQSIEVRTAAITPPSEPDPGRVHRLPRTNARVAQPVALAIPASAARPASQAAAAPGAAEIRATGFPGTKSGDYSRFDSACPGGSDLCVEPTSASIGVSGSAVVETTNEVIAVFDRSGAQLVATSLAAFLGIPADQLVESNPRVVYDAPHRRWVISDMSFGCSLDGSARPTGAVWIAVSNSADPQGSWTIVRAPDDGRLPDSPALGISSDKIVVATNEYSLSSGAAPTCEPASPAFLGTRFWVVDWSAFASPGAKVSVATRDLDATTWGWHPSLGTDGIAADVTAIGVRSTSGGQGDVMLATLAGRVADGSLRITMPSNLTAAGLARPFSTAPAPRQPGGDVKSGPDARPTEVVSRAGDVWFASTLGCTPAGDTAPRACVRLSEIANPAASPAVPNDIVLSEAGADLFVPGLAFRGDGSVVATYSRSTPASSISSYVVSRSASDAAGTVSAPVLLEPGSGSYAGTRWGDYAGLAPDPSSPASAWQVSAVPTAGGGWSTYISNTTPATQPPAGRLVVDGGAASVWAPQARIDAVTSASSATVVMEVASSLNADGSLHSPVTVPAGTHLAFPRPGTPGSQAALYARFGDGRGTWSSVVPATFGNPAVVTRLGGPSRYDTGAAISSATFGPGVDVVYVAVGDNFPDALVGSAIAGGSHAPIVLVTTTAIPDASKTELQRLRPARIVVLGSAAVVSDAVLEQLKLFTTGSVTRVAGSDRFGTAAQLSATAFPKGAATVFLAYGLNFPDALAAAPAAAALHVPILLTDTWRVPTATFDEIGRLHPSKIVLIGSSGVISDDVSTALASWFPWASVERWGGADRFGTAAEISAHAFPRRPSVAFVATAWNFPDGLVGASAAGAIGGPLLLTDVASLAPTTRDELVSLGVARAVVLGSSAVVSANVATQIGATTSPDAANGDVPPAPPVPQGLRMPGVDR